MTTARSRARRCSSRGFAEAARAAFGMARWRALCENRAMRAVRMLMLGLVVAATAACGEVTELEDDGGTLGEIDASGRLDAAADADASVSEDSGSGAQCPTDPCDLHEQCGCGEAEACDLEFLEDGELSGELTCRSVATPPGDETSTCDGLEDCAAGYQCLDGRCRRYCEGDDDCGGPGGRCHVQREGSDREDDRLCSTSCDPVFGADDESCPEGYGCFLSIVDDEGATDCAEPGDVGEGGTCSAEEPCAEGLACVSGAEEPSCRRICRVDEGQCPAGDECVSVQIFVDDVEYGVCASP